MLHLKIELALVVAKRDGSGIGRIRDRCDVAGLFGTTDLLLPRG